MTEKEAGKKGVSIAENVLEQNFVACSEVLQMANKVHIRGRNYIKDQSKVSTF